MLIMLTYDKPLLSGQPPLSGHLLVSEGGHFNNRGLPLFSWFSDVLKNWNICHKFAAVKTATKVN